MTRMVYSFVFCFFTSFSMKFVHFSLGFLTLLALSGCGIDTTGISPESSKQPAGSLTASVVVTEFADLQCPACKNAHILITKPLLEKYGQRIRFEFKHFPLRQAHPFAFTAAQALECASDQGKFWEYLDYNYEHQDQLSTRPYMVWAQTLGLDTSLFERCLESGIKKDAVNTDAEEGNALKVDSTPTYFVNDTEVKLEKADDLQTAVDAALSSVNNIAL